MLAISYKAETQVNPREVSELINRHDCHSNSTGRISLAIQLGLGKDFLKPFSSGPPLSSSQGWAALVSELLNSPNAQAEGAAWPHWHHNRCTAGTAAVPWAGVFSWSRCFQQVRERGHASAPWLRLPWAIQKIAPSSSGKDTQLWAWPQVKLSSLGTGKQIPKEGQNTHGGGLQILN